ncbi:hypothetical protein MKW98_018007 [Papaver atlanticum]|uniref:Uncharacterized protein n=1 Tax=Papaver atlanticum TaxID=357466 RepID=A0AAD4TF73_9MAGN|nr:hypothetical protein MKW98_018007 [Papaver atlanticum]
MLISWSLSVVGICGGWWNEIGSGLKVGELVAEESKGAICGVLAYSDVFFVAAIMHSNLYSFTFEGSY